MASFQQTYAELFGKAKHTVVKPGDRVPIAGLDWRILTSAGALLKQPLAAAGIEHNSAGPLSRISRIPRRSRPG